MGLDNLEDGVGDDNAEESEWMIKGEEAKATTPVNVILIKKRISVSFV